MAMKQNSTSIVKKGEITYSEKTSTAYQTTVMLKNLKEKTGDVILISINNRTTIELPAHLSQDERDARVANYIKLHNLKA
jgi:hypothetical protein